VTDKRKSFLIKKASGEVQVPVEHQGGRVKKRCLSRHLLRRTNRVGGRSSVDILVETLSWSVRGYAADEDAVPFTRGVSVGVACACAVEAVAEVSISGELLRVKEDVSVSSSGIVANFFKTCFRAGRRMGLLKK